MTDAKIEVHRRHIDDYAPDPQNANKGSERGRALLLDSLTKRGAGRSLLADRDGVIIAGNQTLAAARAAGIEHVIEVPLDGKTLLIGRRVDLDLDAADDPRARQLSLDDNRASDFREWAGDALEAAESQIGDLSAWFDGDELADLFDADAAAALVERAVTDGTASRGLTNDKARQVKIALYVEGVADVERALRETGVENRGAALLAVCRHYLATAPTNVTSADVNVEP